MMTTEPLIVGAGDHGRALPGDDQPRGGARGARLDGARVPLSPLETPTGKLLGIVHFQQLLRETSGFSAVGEIIDPDRVAVDPTVPLSVVTREIGHLQPGLDPGDR